MSVVEMTRTQDGLRQLVRSWDPSGAAWGGLLLSHGIAEHSGRYEHVGAAFAEEGLRVRAFDHRGFGRSEGTRAYVDRFEQYLDDLSLRLEAVRREDETLPLYLLGHSLGGLIALAYCLSDRQPRPDRLVLSAPALDAQAPLWQRVSAPFLAQRLPRLAVPNPIDVSQLSRNPAVGDAYVADPLVYRKVTARLGHEILRWMERCRREWSGLVVPTLVVHGGEDTLVPTASSEALGTLPEVRRTVYPGLRHELFNEPEGPQVVADVSAWLGADPG